MIRSVFGKLNRSLSTEVFVCRGILLLGAGFLAAVVLSNIVVRTVRDRVIEFYCPPYWPISVFLPRVPGWDHVLVAAAVAAFFCLVAGLLARIDYRISSVILVGIVLVLGTNLIQGWEHGFAVPIAGGVETGMQFYHDAVRIRDPAVFLRQFEQLQPDLLVHSKVNPPGAVLTMFFLSKLVGDPAYVAVAIAVVSALLSMVFLHGIVSTEYRETGLAGYLTFLFILIPGIQIYYAASLDALVASFLLGVLYFFLHPRLPVSIIGMIVFLFLASFLKFLFVFILPVLVGFEVFRRKSVLRFGSALLALGVIYLIFYAVFNFNYVNSFTIASVIDNPEGFRLLADPASYAFTRLAGILEIVVFFGPFLGVVAMRGIRTTAKAGSDLSTLTWLAVLTLAAMFIAGVFRYGETGRLCMFFYPYLMFPVASWLKDARVSTKGKTALLSLVFSQTVLMQLFGFYFW